MSLLPHAGSVVRKVIQGGENARYESEFFRPCRGWICMATVAVPRARYGSPLGSVGLSLISTPNS